MKNTVLGALVAFAVIVGLASCGGAKTPEQITKEATDKFNAMKADLDKQASDDCTNKKGNYAAAALDSIRHANGDTTHTH